MGFRFRKSINLGGGFKINLSKSGIGYSWGTKGMRFTKTAKGSTRSTFSIPGTGLSYSSGSSQIRSNRAPKKRNKKKVKIPKSASTATVHKNNDISVKKEIKRAFFDKRLAKHTWLLLAAMLGFSAVNNAIPNMFRDSTEEKMSLAMQNAYEQEVDAAYNAMLRQYEEELVLYEENLKQYEVDSASYKEALDANEKEVAQYDEEFALRTEEYSLALETYNAELEAYNAAYDAEYVKAEEAMLKEGVPFSVKISESTIARAEIGSDWWDSFTVNGEEFYGYSGDEIVMLKLGSNVPFFSQIIEQDNSPDIGTARSNHTMTRENFETGFSVTHTVSVRENRGRNAGNTCTFEVTYTLAPEEYTVVVDSAVLPPEPEMPAAPLYSPPLLSIEEPNAPVEPIYPIVRSVGIPEPDYERIVATKADVYANSGFAKFLHWVLIICATPTSIFLAIRLLKAWRQAKQEEKEEMIEKLKQDFLTEEVWLEPRYKLPNQHSYGSEEEKRINIRFLNFLDLKNQLSYEIHHNKYFNAKTASPYLDYNAEAKAHLDELIQESDEKLKSLNTALEKIPDPLHHLRNLIEYTGFKRKSPFFKAPFVKICNNPELSSFFSQSDVSFLEADDDTIFVFTAYHILKYIVSELRFEVKDYQNVNVELIEGSTTKVNLKNPEKVDVLSVSWLYQTKTGKPDKRRVDNPATYVIYDGAVTFRVESYTAAKHYSKKERAEKALEDAKNHILHVAEASGRKAILNECTEEFIEKQYICPEIFKP